MNEDFSNVPRTWNHLLSWERIQGSCGWCILMTETRLVSSQHYNCLKLGVSAVWCLCLAVWDSAFASLEYVHILFRSIGTRKVFVLYSEIYIHTYRKDNGLHNFLSRFVQQNQYLNIGISWGPSQINQIFNRVTSTLSYYVVFHDRQW